MWEVGTSTGWQSLTLLSTNSVVQTAAPLSSLQATLGVCTGTLLHSWRGTATHPRTTPRAPPCTTRPCVRR